MSRLARNDSPGVGVGEAMNRWLFTTALSGATLVALCDPLIAGETQVYAYDELGRLVAVQYSGTVNNNQAHSLCYDPAGNRTQYKSDSTGALTSCAGGTPTPAPTNQPPTANPDTLTVKPCAYGSKDVTANDTDPEGNYPLALTAVTGPYASVDTSTTVGFQAPPTTGTYIVTYTVADSLGATSNGTLTVTVSGANQCF